MTLFLPARIFSVPVLGHGCRAVRLDSCASPFGVQTDIPGVEEDRTGCEEAARDDAARVFGFIHAARLFGPIPSFFLSFFSLDPTSPLLLFYSYLAFQDSD
jgi:hypothetical protein